MDQVLANLLPAFVRERFNNQKGIANISEDQGNVTIIFVDILEFD